MGGPSAATKQQQQLTLQSTEQQMDFNNQLMSLFQKQFAGQQSTLQYLKDTFQPVISNAQAGHGFSPDALAAMRTSATDNLSGQFQNAQAALNQQLKTSGSSNVPSGVTAGADLSLLEAQAQANAGAQRDITLADQQQAKSDLFNASNVLNGVAAQDNPLGYASAATGGSGAIAGLSGSQSELQNAITSANSNSFFGKLSGSFASGLGAGAATFLTGGTNLSSILKGSGGSH